MDTTFWQAGRAGPIVRLLAAFLFGLLAHASHAYVLLTDNVLGGNPKLAKQTYAVYVDDDPAHPGRRDEVVAALDKWREALAARGVTLELRPGKPPQSPLDLARYKAEIPRYNADPPADPKEYTEVTKFFAKQHTLSVYWDTTENIVKRRGGETTGAMAATVWDRDGAGKAGSIDLSDIFLPTDPKGGSEDIARLMIHNLAMHEFGHAAGLDHWSPAQQGEVMRLDATLSTKRFTLGAEELKGLDRIYGEPPRLDARAGAFLRDVDGLSQEIRDLLPASVDQVWEYTYALTSLGGSPASYVQVGVGNAPVYAARGSAGLSDWIVADRDAGDRFLEFHADSNYLGEQTLSGVLSFLSTQPPRSGLIAYAGDVFTADFVPRTVPEPGSWMLLDAAVVALVLVMIRCHPHRMFHEQPLPQREDTTAGESADHGSLRNPHPAYPVPIRSGVHRRAGCP